MPSTKADFRDFYERRIWESHQINNPYEKVRVRHILGFLRCTEKGEMVLDAGCGGGAYTNVLAKSSPVIAVDVSSKAVRTVRQNSADLDTVFFAVCDLKHLPIKNSVVDRVACIDVLEHVDEPKKAVDEISRVLRPQGRMLLFTACGENKLTLEYILRPLIGRLIDSIRFTLGHVSVFTTQRIREMFSQNFVIIDVEYMHHWAGWLFKFFWDTGHLMSLRSHQSQSDASCSSMFRIFWVPLEGEYKLLRKKSLGTEIMIEAIKKPATDSKVVCKPSAPQKSAALTAMSLASRGVSCES